MKYFSAENLAIVAFLAIIAKASVFSINLAESLIIFSMVLGFGLEKILAFKREKEISMSDKLQKDIINLDERVKSMEARSNLDNFARTQRK